MKRLWAVFAAVVVMALAAPPTARSADEYELPPIQYSESAPKNRVSKLQAAIAMGEKSLHAESRFGYLSDLLQGLEIRPDTQMLVFSKTSMQRDRISPRTPRALYFNDDTYVGYCHAGDVIEIATTDPKLGAVFYTVDQTNKSKSTPTITRQTHNCLQCHGAAQTDHIPGFLIRSLFVGPSGLPILSEGSHRVEPSTPIEDRWGGWYVSGTHGAQTHLGNFVIRDRGASKPWKNESGQNVTDLSDRFLSRNYLTPHSDIVALLVFEHQAFVHNLITKANFAARQALYYEASLNRALGEPEGNRLESTTRRIENEGEKLLQGLLMADEAKLSGPIAGTSGFAESFVQSGPRDGRGRSLRDLDLRTRLFKYPCSYLIYSPAFGELPAAMKAYVSARLKEILAGQGGEHFAHLTADDRQTIAEILQETKPELWNHVER